MSGSTEIPVKFVLPNGIIVPAGSPASKYVDASPCVELGFFFSEDAFDGKMHDIQFETQLALIDTGASHIMATPDLIRRHGCRRQPTGRNLRINTDIEAKQFDALLYLKESRTILSTTVYEHNVHKAVPQCSIILGRVFLEKCVITWNGPKHTISIKYIHNRE